MRKTSSVISSSSVSSRPMNGMKNRMKGNGSRAMEKIKVVIENKQKAVKIPTGIRLLMRRCCHAVLELEHFEGSAEVDISIVDNAEIQEINREHRKIDAVTDVLSFPLGENGHYDIHPQTGAKQLGDIVISIERAMVQAEQYGHSLQREMGYLTVHSMLHLLGYDHVDGGLEARPDAGEGRSRHDLGRAPAGRKLRHDRRPLNILPCPFHIKRCKGTGNGVYQEFRIRRERRLVLHTA